MEHYYAMIMAGGGGTRLWPLSRKNRPKQMLSLVDENSLFVNSISRLFPLFAPDHIYITTSTDQLEELRSQVPEIPPENFIVEPYGKENGPAAGLAITHIHQRDPDAVVAYLASDHHITKTEDFRSVLASAYKIALEDNIVTLGITPSYPATGFGYIQQGDYLGTCDSWEYYKSEQFMEKPDRATATTFLLDGNYCWNSGMFIWKTSKAMAEFERQQPKMYSLFQKLAAVLDSDDYDRLLHEVWDEMPKIAIDYAIMEHAEKMVVIPVDIGWSDIGSWQALYDISQKDEQENCIKGENMDQKINLDTYRTFVYSDRLTVTIGVNDLVIIDTEDALLVCHKDRAQDIRTVVNMLKDQDENGYL